MATLGEMFARKARIELAIADIEEMKRQQSAIGREGQFNAMMALACAAVIMVLDVARAGYSSVHPAFGRGFAAWDAGVEKADKLLKLFGQTPSVKKSDLMDSVDPELRNAARMTEFLRSAQGQIKSATKSAGLSGADLASFKKWDFVAKLGIDMAEDTILLLDAGKSSSTISKQVAQSAAKTDKFLHNLKVNLSAVNQALLDALEKMRTA